MTAFRATKDAVEAAVKKGLTIDDTEKAVASVEADVGQIPFTAGEDVTKPFSPFLQAAFHSELIALANKATANKVAVFESGAAQLLELTRGLARADLVEPSLFFYLLDYLAELQTTSECTALFDYLEGIIDSLMAEGLIKVQGHRLALLRLCNGLLRRLSNSYDTVFCGRIIMFVAYVCPLDDRSGLNVLGTFNVGNVTAYEEEDTEGVFQVLEDEQTKDRTEENKSAAVESASKVVREPGAPPMDFNFYKTFWGLQSLLKNPVSIYDPNNWAPLVDSIEQVLAAFSGAAGMDDSTSKKRRKGDKKDKDEGEAAAGDGEGGDIGTFYYPKFLTSSKLMTLQINDTAFRRHMLVQFLILFKYLKANTPKTGTPLSEKQLQVITDLRSKADAILGRTRPRGPRFRIIINRILDREDNWILWKNEKCPSFEQHATAEADSEEQVAKRVKREANIQALANPKRVPMGDKELNRLWQGRTDLDSLRDQDNKHAVVTLDSYLEEFIEQLDPEAEIEKEYWLSNDPTYVWKAMRLMSKDHFSSLAPAANGLPNALASMGLYTPPKEVKVEKPPLAPATSKGDKMDTGETGEDEGGKGDKGDTEPSKEEEDGEAREEDGGDDGDNGEEKDGMEVDEEGAEEDGEEAKDGEEAEEGEQE